MSKPRQCDVYTTSLLTGGKGAAKVTRVAALQDELCASVHSRHAIHPTREVIVSGNSSGRCLVWRR